MPAMFPRRALVSLALAAALVGLRDGAAAEVPRAAATIFPLYDILREVGGPLVEPVLILPPGASPHTFEPRPSNARALARAAVLFRVGHGLDEWAARVAEASGVRKVVSVDAGIRLRRFADGSLDPHYWLSCENARTIARTVAGELALLLPDRRAEIEKRLADCMTRLDAADREIRLALEGLSSRSIATLHDGFGYFADAYGLTIAAVFEPSGDREPTPRAVAQFQRRVREAHVRAIFAEPQLSKDAIRPIAGDLHLPVSTLDDLGGVPGRDSCAALLLFNARQIADALK
jgi:zinc transport system substrate-binding protein